MSTVRLPGHVLPALAGATTTTALDAGGPSSLTLTLVLKRDGQAGFDRYLRGLYDPHAPNYRRFLTQRQIADRFGPSRRTYDRVARWLRVSGLELVEGSVNRLTLTVRGSRGTVERAFSTPIRDFRLADRTFYANASDPALPTEIAHDVQAVLGLANLAKPRGSFQSITAALVCSIAVGIPQFPPAANNKVCLTPPTFKECYTALKNILLGSKSGLTDAQWAQFYQWLSHGTTAPPDVDCATFLNQNPAPPPPPTPSFMSIGTPRAGSDGTGQTIGLLEFDTFEMSDVADYLALIEQDPSVLGNLSEVKVNGGATLGANASEVLLDIDTVMTVAPGAKVVVYDAPFSGAGTSFQTLLNKMIGDGVTVISNSWAYCEDQTTLADVQSIDTILQSAAAAGISVFNGSGDHGSTCLDGAANTIGVPASSPNATAVGGTTALPGPGMVYGSETWWDGSASVPPTGQGGFGVSRFFSRPGYQDGHATSANRSIPDVSSNADPAQGIFICQASGGGCPSGSLYGGTSYTTPVWAAYTALLNQELGHNLGFVNPTLYGLAGSTALHDAASMGSDFAHVGLGSPNLSELTRLLSGQSLGGVSASVSVVSLAFSARPDALGSLPLSLPADGATPGWVVVTLHDANGFAVAGKTVTLQASPPGNVQITPASGVSTVANGAVVFQITSDTPEDVTFTATDTTDGVVLDQTATVTFEVPPATSANIGAFPTTVTADGMASTTITVMLTDVLGRPTPGKEILLSQGAGHAFITAPSPGVTDGAGQIQFTATNLVNETVTFTAVDVTDGELPVPGSAQVTFNNGTGTACGNGAVIPTAQNGYVLTPWAGGFTASRFMYASITFDACFGGSFPAFVGDGAYLTNFFNGDVFKLPVAGGTASSANRLATLNPTIGAPVVGKDGKIYAPIAATMNDINQGAVVELDPVTGAIARTVAPNLRCPFFLAVDPLSGDLFFDDGCSGAGADPKIHRIRNPAGPTPTVEDYVSLATPFSSANGSMAFAPNGSLYVVADYFNPAPPVVRIGGTNGPTPPTVTPLPGLASYFWLNIAETQSDGEARSLVLLFSDGLKIVDITTSPPTQTIVAQNLGGGTIGPDGCLYAGTGTAVYKLTDSSGGCTFQPTVATPSLVLSPGAVVPDPAQGGTQTFTARFRSIDAAPGTAVTFNVVGANPGVRLGRTGADGTASVSYPGINVGRDRIAATATAGGTQLVSNIARVTWSPGKHVTFLTLNPSPRAATPSQRVDVVASITDISASPAAQVPGVNVDFQLDTAQCSAATNAQGLATCQLVASRLGSQSLTATFEGTPELVGSSDTIGFAVSCPGGLDGANCYLDQITATLNAAAATDVKAKVKKQLLGKVKKLKKAVTKAGAPGKKGAKATKKLGKKLDGFVKQLQRLSSKKMAATLRDALVVLATSARAAVPAASQ